MALKTLKQGLGEAGAYLGRSVGGDNLYDVLKAIAQGSPTSIAFNLTTLSAGIKAVQLLGSDMKACRLFMYIGTSGTVGTTTVQVLNDGTVIGELSIANTEPDGTQKTLDINTELQEGDRISLNVSAFATGGANLTASLGLCAVNIE